MTYPHVPHPHIRRAAGPVKVADQHPTGTGFARLNARLGVGITAAVGTMGCAYLFAAIALISAPIAFASGSALIIVAWVAQTFLQLVLLPVIIVGQNVQAAAADKRAEATYNDVSLILHEFGQLHARLDAQAQT